MILNNSESQNKTNKIEEMKKKTFYMNYNTVSLPTTPGGSPKKIEKIHKKQSFFSNFDDSITQSKIKDLQASLDQKLVIFERQENFMTNKRRKNQLTTLCQISIKHLSQLFPLLSPILSKILGLLDKMISLNPKKSTLKSNSKTSLVNLNKRVLSPQAQSPKHIFANIKHISTLEANGKNNFAASMKNLNRKIEVRTPKQRKSHIETNNFLSPDNSNLNTEATSKYQSPSSNNSTLSIKVDIRNRKGFPVIPKLDLNLLKNGRKESIKIKEEFNAEFYKNISEFSPSWRESSNNYFGANLAP